MKDAAYFALGTVALAGVAYVFLRLPFDSPAERQAMQLSGLLALCVQLMTFAIAKRGPGNILIIRWGIGAAVRLLSVALYALVVVPAARVPLDAALLSFVTFLFLSMLIEPLLLRHES